jgi:hypothetical protein
MKRNNSSLASPLPSNTGNGTHTVTAKKQCVGHERLSGEDNTASAGSSMDFDPTPHKLSNDDMLCSVWSTAPELNLGGDGKAASAGSSMNNVSSTHDTPSNSEEGGEDDADCDEENEMDVDSRDVGSINAVVGICCIVDL